MNKLNLMDEEDSDYLASIRAAFSPRDQEVMERLEPVKSEYIPCGRDVRVRETLNEFLVQTLAMKNGRRDDGRIFFVTGPSGAGKTALVKRMLEKCEPLQPRMKSFGFVRPVISISLQGPIILRVLGEEVMKAAGYPRTQKIGQSDTWKLLPEFLHAKKVLIVHIDEAQHMLRNINSDDERNQLAQTLKGAMNQEEWPISFILSGLENTIKLADLDEQFERRGYFSHLPDIDIETERKLVERIISRKCEVAGLSSEGLLSSDLPERICHVARYKYGRVNQVVTSAIQAAFREPSEALTRDHFALAYLSLSHARGYDHKNPFLADHWQDLDAGSFFIGGEK